MKKLTVLFLLGLMLVGCANPTLQQVDETVEGEEQGVSRATRFNDARFISQVVPKVVEPGQNFYVRFKMQNTGRSTWTKAKMYRLGFRAPQDGSTFGTHRIMMVENSVYPGGVATFTATLRAPSRNGEYNFRWRMLQELREWFGQDTALIKVRVGKTSNKARYMSQSVPTVVKAGKYFNVQIRMRNDGTSTWSRESMHRLGFWAPQDGTTFGTGRIEMGNSPVSFGGICTFTATLRAPEKPGVYKFQWRMLQEMKEWFGDTTKALEIRVDDDVSVYKVYEAEGALIRHNTGSAISDGWRVTVNDQRGYMAYGPYVTDLPRIKLRATFFLRVDNTTYNNGRVCMIDVCTNGGRNVLESKEIRRKEFNHPWQYQPFTLDFDNNAGGPVEFRVRYIGNSMLDMDKVVVSN